MGWIEKNGKRQYRITKTVSHKLNKAGNEIGIRKEFFGNTKKEAEQKYKEFLENRALGVENQKQYFGVMADGFINEFFLPDGDLKDSTKNMYYRSWYKHIATADIYGLRLTDVTAKTIQQTYNNLSKEGVPASTIRKINNLMKRFYQYIVSEGYGRDITANISIPKTKTEKHKTSDTKITVWTDEEIKKIFSGFENADYRFRFRFLIVLAYYTGCRRSELLALTYDDITENGITINKQLGEITKDVLTHENVVRGYDITAPKTKNAYRTIPINEEVLKELHIHKQWHKAEQLKERYRTNYIFTSSSGTLLDPRNVDRALRRYYNSIGVEEKGMHTYRHTFGTNLCKKGVAIQTASVLLGHDDISTTAKYYVDISEEEKQRAIDCLKLSI